MRLPVKVPAICATTGRSRRRFMGRAAVAGAATVGFPALSRAQGPIRLRWQSAWPAKSPLHEYALDYAATVNDLTGGDLRIEILPVGALAPLAGMLDAVAKGALDGSHGSPVHHYGRQAAFALWGAGPAYGMDANMLLAWHRHGGGAALLAKLYSSLGVDVVSFVYGPMSTQPLGWFRKPIAKVDDFRGLRFRTAEPSVEAFAALGAAANALPEGEVVAALERGTLDGAELMNVTADRIAGLPGVAGVCMLQSFHRNAEPLEIVINKVKFDALPAPTKAIVASAADACSATTAWKSLDRNSRDYFDLQTKIRVKFYKTPDAILQKQLDVHDLVAAKQAQDNPLFREIAESQKAFAARVVRFDMDNSVNRRMAFNHYFGAPAAGGRKP